MTSGSHRHKHTWRYRLFLLACAVAGGLTGYLLDPTQAASALGTWLKSNDTRIDEITVWCMAVGLVILAAVDARTWWSLRWQRDRTSVGGSLRAKKFWYGMILFTLGTLYVLTLAVYYGLIDVNFWHRIVLRAVVIVSMVGAVIAGIRFVRAMRGQKWGRPS